MPTSCPQKHFGRHFVEMEFNFEVVISGISGRFPECDDIDTFKKKLYAGNSKEFITNNEKKWAKGFKLKRYGRYLLELTLVDSDQRKLFDL